MAFGILPIVLPDPALALGLGHSNVTRDGQCHGVQSCGALSHSRVLDSAFAIA